MAFNDTHPDHPQARGRHRSASITDIGEALRRRRSRTDSAADEGTPEPEPVVPLQGGAVVGYFLHEGRCIKVEYGASECLWVYERACTPDTGPLGDFYAFNRLKYAELGHITWPMRAVRFAYLGVETEPTWMPIPSPSLAELLRKVFSLYDCVTKGAAANAADDLVPNPAPPRYDPNRKAR